MNEQSQSSEALTPSISGEVNPVDVAENKPKSPEESIKEIGKDLQKAVNDITDTKTIAILGFFVVTIMVVTMFLMVAQFVYEVFRDRMQSDRDMINQGWVKVIHDNREAATSSTQMMIPRRMISPFDPL